MALKVTIFRVEKPLFRKNGCFPNSLFPGDEIIPDGPEAIHTGLFKHHNGSREKSGFCRANFIELIKKCRKELIQEKDSNTHIYYEGDKSMKKIDIALLVAILFTSIILTGCGQKKEDPNKRTVKIEVNVKEGQTPVNPTVNGGLNANDSKSAGFVSQIIKITPPGFQEIKCGPSEYELKLLDFNSRHHELKMYMDGKEMKRGQDMVVIDNPERGFSVTFKIDEKGAGENKGE